MLGTRSTDCRLRDSTNENRLSGHSSWAPFVGHVTTQPAPPMLSFSRQQILYYIGSVFLIATAACGVFSIYNFYSYWHLYFTSAREPLGPFADVILDSTRFHKVGKLGWKYCTLSLISMFFAYLLMNEDAFPLRETASTHDDLHACPECGRIISRESKICPRCEHRFPTES